VFAFDAVSGEVTNLGLSIAFFPPVGGPLAAFGVNEAASSLDLNGDGLQSDQVYVVYDPVTQRFDNTRRNLSLNLIPASAGSRYAIPFEEDSVQGPDLNGDGDIKGDKVVHLYADGEWISTSLACSSYSLGEDLLAVEVSESAQGMDLNGDGNLEIVVQTFGVGAFVYTVPDSAENLLLWPTGRGNYLRDGRPWEVPMRKPPIGPFMLLLQ